uniref:Putative secreted peptide n=1 Tax=Anopheles braziliensis TaxID=58242 RepID=A0A2M3ZWH0_9DIPT
MVSFSILWAIPTANARDRGLRVLAERRKTFLIFIHFPPRSRVLCCENRHLRQPYTSWRTVTEGIGCAPEPAG